MAWAHSKKEMKDQNVFSPIFVVATNKSISFYEISLKNAALVHYQRSCHSQIKSVKIACSNLWCNRLNQVIVAAEAVSGRIHVFTVREMGVVVLFSYSHETQKLHAFSPPESPTKQNTFVSTLYRATYFYQYSESRGVLFVYAFSNRDNEFKYYNTVALYTFT